MLPSLFDLPQMPLERPKMNPPQEDDTKSQEAHEGIEPAGSGQREIDQGKPVV